MAYEVEPIIAGSNAPVTQTSQQAIMREERVLNPYNPTPYKQMGQKPSEPEKIGQSDTVGSTPEESVKLSPQVAALARREQQFRAKQMKLEQERQSMAAEKEELSQLRAMKQKLAAKDYSALEGMVDYNDYSQYQVNKLNGADPVRDEFNKLNGKISEMEKAAQDNLNRQYEAAVSERRTAAQTLIDADDSKFPRIKKAKAHEAVVKHILDTWEHDSQELSVEQAAKEVEEILIEQARKWSALLEEEKVEPAPPEAKRNLPPLKQGLKTLTNQINAGDFKGPRKPLSQFSSDAERWAEARRRAEEKLSGR